MSKLFLLLVLQPSKAAKTRPVTQLSRHNPLHSHTGLCTETVWYLDTTWPARST